MNDQANRRIPTEINLHRKSRLLRMTFSDGETFDLPCEYLRVFSKAAEVVTRDLPETGKEQVNIDRIEPQGSYAIRIVFDDGHDTGIYSWETLYDLGVNLEAYWQDYLDRLAATGYTREGTRLGDAGEGERNIKLLYFAYLAEYLRKEAEEVTPPNSVEDVQSLLAWLRKKERDRGYLLADDNVRVTVNKQFTEPFTKLDPGDEVAIVPVTPTPPAPPKRTS